MYLLGLSVGLTAAADAKPTLDLSDVVDDA
jgi:hypothetical protein